MSKKTRVRRAQRHTWTNAERRFLRLRYPHVKTATLAAALGLGVVQVASKASALGLRKSAEFPGSLEACRLNGIVGMAGRFKPSSTPWNKGTHFDAGGRSAETRFKAGQLPKNYLPIGSERLNDGYLQRKMTDTGYPPRDWVSVHTMLWIEHHGPVPKGSVVALKDGNKTHITLKNLELLTRAELMARNSINRYPPAIKAVIRLAGRLKHTIERAAHEKQD